MIVEVQWAQWHSTGARSWAYHGISKVHRREAGEYRTLCGVRLPVPFASRQLPPHAGESRCLRCAKKAAAA